MPEQAQPRDMQQHDERLENPTVKREQSDVRVRWVFVITAIAVAALALHFTVVRFYLRSHAAERIPAEPYSPEQTPGQLPPPPRLEPLDRHAGLSSNINGRDSSRDDALHRYGPATEPGFARVPIAEAIRAAAGKLPVRKERPDGAYKSRGLITGGESNSGRKFGEPPP
jgi:hypothetical protein